MFWRVINIILMISIVWAFGMSLTGIILFGVSFEKMLSHPIYIIICLIYICIPSLLKIIDAWSNTLILSLTQSLQKHDYNRQFRTNYFQFLQKKERKRRKDIDENGKTKKKPKKASKSRSHVKGFTKVDTYYEEFR